MPLVSLGPPQNAANYVITDIDKITIYYPINLQRKEGYSYIKVKLRKVLFWSWLELEGAKAIASYH